MYVYRRRAALILFLVALAAVAAFALGITLCIDWTGGGAPPRDLGPAAASTFRVL